ncbi:MAG: hypothetical protein V4562_07900 [Pseudomonadota bacterium]
MLTLAHPLKMPPVLALRSASPQRSRTPCAWAGGLPSQFAAMQAAYGECGGMLRAEELVALSSLRDGPDVSQLARWIVERTVMGVEWQKQLWLPLFQFSPSGLEPRTDIQPVMAELVPVMDAWALAVWFARPHPALGSRSPLASLANDLSAVRNAARFDRFIAHG